MRIKEFQIHRYGPLSPSDRITLGPFNLFWGENEEGKTLTIDAVIKLLFGKATRLFPFIDRIEEEPSGFIVLEDASKKEIRLGGKMVLPALFNMTVEAAITGIEGAFTAVVTAFEYPFHRRLARIEQGDFCCFYTAPVDA